MFPLRRGALGSTVAAAMALTVAGSAEGQAPLAAIEAKPPVAVRRNVATFEADYATAPSYRYANMDNDACFAELGRRGIVHQRMPEARGVLAPVRLPEGVRGIVFRTALSRERGAESPWEVFDCRLVLALHDFAEILHAHDIDEVLIYSAWRPPPKSWPAARQARRHPGGLAVDLYRFRQRVRAPAPAASETPVAVGEEPVAAAEVESAEPDSACNCQCPAPPDPPTPYDTPEAKAAPSPTIIVGHRWIDVEQHFHGNIGAALCGPSAEPPTADVFEAHALRSIVCAAAAQRIFTSTLSPNYDRPHFNHFHLEVTPGARWRIVR